MTDICPICSAEALKPTVLTEQLTYSGKQISVEGIEVSVCENCGEEVVRPDQAKRNDVRFADARRIHDGLLTSAQIKGFRERWSLTQQQASAALGGGANAFSKYERGEVTQAQSMDLLMRVADMFPQVRDFLGARSKVDFRPAKVEPSKALHWEDLMLVEVRSRRALDFLPVPKVVLDAVSERAPIGRGAGVVKKPHAPQVAPAWEFEIQGQKHVVN